MLEFRQLNNDLRRRSSEKREQVSPSPSDCSAKCWDEPVQWSRSLSLLYWKPLGIDCLFLRNCRTTLMLLGRVNVYFNHIWTFQSWPVWFSKCRSEERTHILTHINTEQPDFLSIVKARRNSQSSPAAFFWVFTRQSTLQAGRSEGNEESQGIEDWHRI